MADLRDEDQNRYKYCAAVNTTMQTGFIEQRVFATRTSVHDL